MNSFSCSADGWSSLHASLSSRTNLASFTSSFPNANPFRFSFTAMAHLTKSRHSSARNLNGRSRASAHSMIFAARKGATPRSVRRLFTGSLSLSGVPTGAEYDAVPTNRLVTRRGVARGQRGAQVGRWKWLAGGRDSKSYGKGLKSQRPRYAGQVPEMLGADGAIATGTPPPCEFFSTPVRHQSIQFGQFPTTC